MTKPMVYSLTLTLNNWKPNVWRRLWVREDTPLPILSSIFYMSMGWGGYHLAEIRVAKNSYSYPSTDLPNAWLDWNKYSLGDVITPSMKHFSYTYDFGDSWDFGVRIKEEPKLFYETPYPVCVNGKNAAPPEDVGSYVGFEHFIDVMKNIKHEEYDETCEWYGDTFFDPSSFSVDEVNDVIQTPKSYPQEFRIYIKKSLLL